MTFLKGPAPCAEVDSVDATRKDTFRPSCVDMRIDSRERPNSEGCVRDKRRGALARARARAHLNARVAQCVVPGSTTRYSRDRSTRRRAFCCSSSHISARPQSGNVLQRHSNSQQTNAAHSCCETYRALDRHEQAALLRWLDAESKAGGLYDRAPAVSVDRPWAF